MTAITNLPDLRPSLLLDFANSGRVDPRIQCVRSSSATCFGPDGKLRTVAANVPRIDYGPVTGKCLGLLLEPSRTNLLKYSEQFDNGAWTKAIGSPTISANTATAPDGTTTADKLIEDTLVGAKLIRQTASLTANKTYTLSVFAKAGERSHISMSHANQSNWSAAGDLIINLASGTVHSNPIPGSIVSIRSVGAGWYLCSLTLAFGTRDAGGGINIGISNGGTSITYQGDGTSGIYIWGAQLEEGSYPTSYIPTAASSVTRAADAPQTTLKRGEDFTVIAEVERDVFTGTFPRYFSINSGGYADELSIATAAGDFVTLVRGVGGSLTSANVVTGAGKHLRIALSYSRATGLASALANGGAVSTLAALQPLGDILGIGQVANGADVISTRVARIALYDRALTTAQMQRLTA